MEPTTTFDNPEAEARHFRSLARTLQDDLDDTKLALDEFRASAGELEKELENELALAEKEVKAVKGREDALKADLETSKAGTKYQTALKEHTKTMTHMQSELDELRKSNEEYRKRLRDMELDNDELEGKERMVTSSLQDVETKYGKAIERITLLEEELIEKSKLEEECQRLRDDLREMTEEVGVLRDQATSAARAFPPPSTPASASPVPLPRSLSVSPSRGVPARPRAVSTASPRTTSPTRPNRPSSTVDADLTPRKRLVSVAATPSSRPSGTNSPGGSMLPRSTSTSAAVFGSGGGAGLSRLSRMPSFPHPPRQANASPSGIPTRTEANGVLASSTTSTASSSGLARSTHRRDLSSVASGSRPRSGAGGFRTGPSHIATLRAETKRMQGLTQKLVSSRNLREVSAIPVPKGMTASGSSGSATGLAGRTNLGRTNTLARSTLGKAPATTATTRPGPTGRPEDAATPTTAKKGPRRSLVASPPPSGRPARPPSRIARASIGPSDIAANGVPPIPSRSPTPSSGMFRSAIGAVLASSRASEASSPGPDGRPSSSLQNYSRPTSAQSGLPEPPASASGIPTNGRRKSLGPGPGAERGFRFGFGSGVPTGRTPSDQLKKSVGPGRK